MWQVLHTVTCCFIGHVFHCRLIHHGNHGDTEVNPESIDIEEAEKAQQRQLVPSAKTS
jgi:hypothetical protein